jgi:hypothetical protein
LSSMARSVLQESDTIFLVLQIWRSLKFGDPKKRRPPLARIEINRP